MKPGRIERKIMDNESFEITMKALNKAWGAFCDYLEKDGLDPGHWDIRFTAWLCTSDFTQRLTKFEIEHECKEVKDGG